MRIVAELLDEHDYEWYPVIPDWHDQFIIECRPEDAQAIKDLIETEVYDRLNRAIGFTIGLAGEGQVVENSRGVSATLAKRSSGFSDRFRRPLGGKRVGRSRSVRSSRQLPCHCFLGLEEF